MPDAATTVQWSCLSKIYGGAPEVPAQNIQSSEKLRSPASGFQANPGKIPQSFEQRIIHKDVG